VVRISPLEINGERTNYCACEAESCSTPVGLRNSSCLPPVVVVVPARSGKMHREEGGGENAVHTKRGHFQPSVKPGKAGAYPAMAPVKQDMKIERAGRSSPA